MKMKEEEFNVGGKDFIGYLLSMDASKTKGPGAWMYCAIYLTTTSEIIAHTVRYEKSIEKESMVQTVLDFRELNSSIILLGAMLDAMEMKSIIDEYFLLKPPIDYKPVKYGVRLYYTSDGRYYLGSLVDIKEISKTEAKEWCVKTFME